jgi:hypothetical protein
MTDSEREAADGLAAAITEMNKAIEAATWKLGKLLVLTGDSDVIKKIEALDKARGELTDAFNAYRAARERAGKES